MSEINPPTLTSAKGDTIIPLVICGRGRIGGKLAKRLNAEGIHYQTARLDRQQGLLLTESQARITINLLVVCIAPRLTSQSLPEWCWNEILAGMLEQLAAGTLAINNLVLVSSTRVYDGIHKGLVSAATASYSFSKKGAQIIHAETQLLSAIKNVRILRCAGLYGSCYQQYLPIMLAATDQPRFGIDWMTVVERLFELVMCTREQDLTRGIELLTDGKLYFQGKSFKTESELKRIEEMIPGARILLNSRAVLD